MALPPPPENVVATVNANNSISLEWTFDPTWFAFDGTDDMVELANGANVYSISDEEVAITNARDGSITITTTEK